MSGLAHVLLDSGEDVAGSDLAESAATARLAQKGARIYIGHDEAHIAREAPDVVVYSSAVPADNPELRYARRAGIPVLARGEMLARLMNSRKGIAVAGTHGKTTVTSMIALVLERSGADPTLVVGGEMRDLGTNAKAGRGEYFVAEADESDRSFLHLAPVIAVVTNIDADHLEHYEGIDDIVAAFRAFLEKLPREGVAVVCGDDANAVRAAPEHCRVVTYGLNGDYDYTADGIELLPFGSRFTVKTREGVLGPVTLRVPGRHNIANALAAVAAARAAGFTFEQAAAALAEFRGAKRRLDVLGEERGVMVIDDYAHHPTEIRATLAAVRNLRRRRIVAVFQPHRYTRTKLLLHELAASFGDADLVVLTDIYAALEPPIPGVTIDVLAEQMRAVAGDKVALVRDLDAVPGFLLAATRPGDVVVTIGAGDVRRAGEAFLTLARSAPALVAHLTPSAAEGAGVSAEEA